MTSFPKLTAHLDSIVENNLTPANDCIVCKDHEILYRHFSGHLDIGKSKSVDENTLYYLFSGSKVITVTAALQLIEQGKMGLDDPVMNYLPDFADAYILSRKEKKIVGPEMTIRHLFTMSSGLDYDWERANDTIQNCTDHVPGTVEIVNGFVKRPLIFRPGRRFLYSLSHDVLGALVEVVSGQPFGQYLKENIFDVVDMPHTFFPPRGEDGIGYQHPDLVKLYTYTEGSDTPLKPFFNGYIFTDKYESGGAGLITNAIDYIRLADALACGGVCANGKRILKEETIRLLGSEQLTSLLTDPTFECASGPGYGYGLGVRVLVDQNNGQRSSIGEFGWDGAVGAYILSDPVKHVSMIYLQSANGWVEPIKGHQIMRDLAYEEMEN